jgi:hypothetical protein
MTNENESPAAPAADPYTPQHFTLAITFTPGAGWKAHFTDGGQQQGAEPSFTGDNPAMLLAEVTKVLRPLHRSPWQVFKTTHGDMAVRALRWFAAYMYREAASARTLYETLTADPEAAARQDQTMFTTNAYDYSAKAFAQSAEQADRAREAFKALNGDREYALMDFGSRYGHVLTNALTVMAEHLREDGTPEQDAAQLADAAGAAREAWELLTEPDEEPLDSGFQD